MVSYVVRQVHLKHMVDSRWDWATMVTPSTGGIMHNCNFSQHFHSLKLVCAPQ